MFIGSINRHMRAVLEQAAGQWKGLPVYVACSGNFTVERILARCGVGSIHSNDVSIYSCALGWHLAGAFSDSEDSQAVRYRVKDQAEEFAWLGEYLQDGLATIATLLLAGEMLKVGPMPGSGKELNPYARRMREAYRRRWPGLHAATAERVKRALGGLSIASYFAGDCRDFLAGADRDGVCISFPPTYKGGYERLFKKLEAVFGWPASSYRVFGPEDFEQFSAAVRSFRHWMISSDTPQPALEHQHVATVQTSLLSKPVYMYSDAAPPRLATARQRLGRNPWPPRTDEVVEPIQIARIDAATMNAIRSLYLARSITVCDAPRNYAVLSAGRLVGAFSFVDVHNKLLYYCVCAWQEDFTGFVIDYGTFPEQTERVFALDGSRRTLGRAFPGAGPDGAIQAGLEKLVSSYLATDFRRGTGLMRIDRLLVDMGYKPGIVAAVKHKAGGSWPCGRSAATSMPISLPRRSARAGT